KRTDLIGRDVEDEVRVAAEHARIDRQTVQPWLIAVRLAQQERHVTVRAIAQHAVDDALAGAVLNAQHRRFRQPIDDPQACGWSRHQSAERLLDIAEYRPDARPGAIGTGAAVDRIRCSVERPRPLHQLAFEVVLGVLFIEFHARGRIVVDGLVIHP
nr:hypothetical protein [Tanacetum cinerariifolium]